MTAPVSQAVENINSHQLFPGCMVMGDLPFGYEDFSDWFDLHERDYLEPARDAAVKLLAEHLDAVLPEIQRIRVKVSHGRVKGKERTWQKLESKYRGRVGGLDDIPKVVDDLVGLRIVCNNKSDVQRVVDIVCGLDCYEEGTQPALAQQHGSLRDNLEKPRETGYRAVHINLCTSIASRLSWKEIICELQVRTLLQDGWGELTHEDTYKPGSAPPALVEKLSRRMADLLASVDDIAQDLREELDRLGSINIEEPSGGESVVSGAAYAAVPPLDAYRLGLREAALHYLRSRVEGIERPVDLASLAWELRKEFGQGVSEEWLGFGTFKSLLKASAPSVRVTDEPPSYVLPRDYEASIPGAAQEGYPGIPEAALIMRGVDRGFPLISKSRLNAAYAQLADASQCIDWNDSTVHDIGRLNEMTRRAREFNASENQVSRSHLDYIAKSILFSGNLNRPLSADEVKAIYATSAINRIQGVSADIGHNQLEDVREWLT